MDCYQIAHRMFLEKCIYNEEKNPKEAEVKVIPFLICSIVFREGALLNMRYYYYHHQQQQNIIIIIMFISSSSSICIIGYSKFINLLEVMYPRKSTV